MTNVFVENITTQVEIEAGYDLFEVVIEDFDQAEIQRYAELAAESAAEALASEEAAADSADAASASQIAAASSATSASNSASSATNSASTATTQSGIATTQAGIATTQAGIATTKANEASASAAAALASENDAETAASTATTQAGIATGQAGIATTKADEASTSAANALASADTAATQAGIATTQAGNALTSANNAAASAVAAANSASQAAQVGTSTLLTGYTVGPNTPIAATDSILTAFGEVQGQINARVSGTIATGQVAFGTAANTIGGDNGLFWDNTNKRLGVNTNAPAGRFVVNGGGSSNMASFTNDTQGGLIAIGNNNSNGAAGTNTIGGVAYAAAITFGAVDNQGIRVISRTHAAIMSANIGSSGRGSLLFLTKGTLDNSDPTEKWRIGETGILQSNGAQTIQTSTGNLILTSADNTGIVDIRRNDQRNGAELRLTNAFNGSGWLVGDVVGSLNFVSADPTTTQPIRSRIQAISSGGVTFPSLMNLTFSTANGDVLTEGFRLTNLSNVLIGTTTDAGQRLQVTGTTLLNGVQILQGTTATDTAPLGPELTTTGTGTNWTGTDFATGYTHVVGSTASLTTTLVAVVGTYYQITYTVTGRTAGTFTINYGGTSTVGITGTGNTGPVATTAATLEIVPTTDFNGTIVLSVRTIGNSSPTTLFRSSAGTTTNEIRVSDNNNNTFVGLNSGRRNTTGTNNSFFGMNSAVNNTTGSNNTFVGRGAGFANSIGGSNSFFGNSAGIANTTGSNNSFFGRESGNSNTTGTSNSFFGVNAGASNTTGIQNTLLGVDSGATLNTGSNNLMVGVRAGRFLSNGTTALAIADNSVFLGFDTRANGNSETNQIVIGHTAIGLGSNTTVVGNSSTTFGRWFGNLLLGTSTNVASSIFTMSSTTQGFLPPRMTSTERNAIATPATGLMVYNTTDNRPSFYNGTSWINL